MGGDLIAEAKKQKLREHTAFVIGGIIPSDEAEKLKEIGFDCVFMPGATKEEIVSSIREIASNIVKKSL